MADPHGRAMVSTARQVEAIANPVRSRILRHAGRPVSVAELAERFDVPTTRLYYHVNLLVDEGFLVQVDQRKSGARIERIYMRTASSFDLDPGLAEAVGDARKAAELAASVLLEPARAEFEAGLERLLTGRELGGTLSRSVVHLTPAEAADFEQRVRQLVKDMVAASRPDDPTTSAFAITSALLPIEAGEEP